MLEKCFGKDEFVNFKKFLNIVENVCSDIFLYILIFILEKRPFTTKTLENYDAAKVKNLLKVSKSPQILPNKMIASPNLNSKFSPCITISKSPMMTRKTLFDVKKRDDKKDLLLKLSGKADPNPDSRNVLLKYAQGIPGKAKADETDENVIVKGIPVNRKNRNNLKNIESFESNQNFGSVKKTEFDLPITYAVKYKSEGGPKISGDDVVKISKE